MIERGRTVSDAETEAETLRLLRRIESKLDNGFEGTNARVERLAERLGEAIASSRREMCEQLHATEKRLALETDELARALADYHATAIGNGVRLRDLDLRIRRLEQIVSVLSPGPK
jgi:DNA anti-recombination protein RmuC